MVRGVKWDDHLESLITAKWSVPLNVCLCVWNDDFMVEADVIFIWDEEEDKIEPDNGDIEGAWWGIGGEIDEDVFTTSLIVWSFDCELCNLSKELDREALDCEPDEESEAEYSVKRSEGDCSGEDEGSLCWTPQHIPDEVEETEERDADGWIAEEDDTEIPQEDEEEYDDEGEGKDADDVEKVDEESDDEDEELETEPFGDWSVLNLLTIFFSSDTIYSDILAHHDLVSLGRSSPTIWSTSSRLYFLSDHVSVSNKLYRYVSFFLAATDRHLNTTTELSFCAMR